jgi:hypothetical protein
MKLMIHTFCASALVLLMVYLWVNRQAQRAGVTLRAAEWMDKLGRAINVEGASAADFVHHRFSWPQQRVREDLARPQCQHAKALWRMGAGHVV